METLPPEIIEKILCCELSVQDIVRFSATCSHFRSIVANSRVIWKPKFIERYPEFTHLLDENFTEWYKELQYVCRLLKRSRTLLTTRSSKFNNKQSGSVSHFKVWSALCKQHPRAYQYILMASRNLVQKLGDPFSVWFLSPRQRAMLNYSEHLLKYLVKNQLSKEWSDFIALPAEQHILERGAAFFSRWFHVNDEDTPWEEIALRLDDVADQVKGYLKLTNSDHPIFSVSADTLTRWRTKNFVSNQFNMFECKQIMNALNYVLYQQLRFTGQNSENCELNDFYIEKVLERTKGSRILLTVIYESVARRLGLKCEPVQLQGDCLLRFVDPFGSECYVDALDNGHLVTSYHEQENTAGSTNNRFAIIEQVVDVMAVHARNIFLDPQPLFPKVQRRANLELQQLVRSIRQTLQRGHANISL